MVLMAEGLADLHLVGAGSSAQCFPQSHLKDSAITQFRQHYSNDSISKEDVFHCLYDPLTANGKFGAPFIMPAPRFR